MVGSVSSADICEVGRSAGLDAVGIAPAAVFSSTREVLEERRREGMSGGMQFTYRNPERSTDPGRILAGARSLVVGARRYERQQPTPAGRAGVDARVARYSWTDHYARLRTALGEVAAELKSAGWKARVVADDNALVDREAAYRAGLGWYGKNSNLLLGSAGSWFVLGSVVTDAPLETSPPAEGGCGTCTRCLRSCPTGALVAPGVLDARRCLAWLLQAPGPLPREYRAVVGNRIYGCDDCQEVCPVNVRMGRSTPAPDAEEDAETVVDVLQLLAASDEEILQRWGRWYIAGRDPAQLRRNALVVLGNVADGGDSRVEAALREALIDPRPLVASHAVWAADRLGRGDLLHLVGDDPAPMIAEELAHLGEVAGL